MSNKILDMENNLDMKKKPLVSICIPVYNGEKTIEKTLQSIINQTYENIEIIVVDNLSTDNTEIIVKAFTDPRIRFIQNGVHFTAGEYNWNTCFNHANGEFLAIFHADDIYDPTIIEKQVSVFDKHPEISAVFTEGNIIDENDKIIGKLKKPNKMKGPYKLNYETVLIETIENGNFLTSPTAMVKTELYKTLAPFRYECFKSASDVDMWLRISQKSPIAFIEEKLFNYRVSVNQGSFILIHQRTTRADIYSVLDFHISHFSGYLSKITFYRYLFSILSNKIHRSRNLFITGDKESGKLLLYECISFNYLISLVITSIRPIKMIYSVIIPMFQIFKYLYINKLKK